MRRRWLKTKRKIETRSATGKSQRSQTTDGLLLMMKKKVFPFISSFPCLMLFILYSIAGNLYTCIIIAFDTQQYIVRMPIPALCTASHQEYHVYIHYICNTIHGSVRLYTNGSLAASGAALLWLLGLWPFLKLATQMKSRRRCCLSWFSPLSLSLLDFISFLLLCFPCWNATPFMTPFLSAVLYAVPASISHVNSLWLRTVFLFFLFILNSFLFLQLFLVVFLLFFLWGSSRFAPMCVFVFSQANALLLRPHRPIPRNRAHHVTTSKMQQQLKFTTVFDDRGMRHVCMTHTSLALVVCRSFSFSS